eukprot:NODE_10469_length_1349_cov_6.963175.p1 GENE.NODE_10469_length_1349_cov_6.963175~~NODE_10469_length_1349_cov_6.963175.p1  ORF type:complete len:165 (-),score=43.24 NODE_10469_length_1349_cov_6.963175:353-847(-)
MADGENIALCPGGFADATMTRSYEDGTVVRTRCMQILLRHGLQHGYNVHPVYTFGEHTLFSTATGGEQLRLRLNKFNIPGVIFYGDPFCPLFPRSQSELYTYVGRPLKLPRIAEPTPEDVELWMCEYEQALVGVYEEFKAEAGYPHGHLHLRTAGSTAPRMSKL